MRVAACVDCATTIIGERQRCPRCHDRHARGVVAFAPIVASPRRELGRGLVAWMIALEVLAVVVGALFATRGCM